MRAEYEAGEIWFTVTYAEQGLIKSLPGTRYDKKRDMWHIKATWATCLTMRALFGKALELGPALVQWGGTQLEYEKHAHKLAESLEPFTSGGDWDERLFGYQRVGAEFLAFTNRALLADEPGLGKTAQTIAAIKALHESGQEVFPILVVCPQSLKRTWEREIEQWWPDLAGKIQVIDGSVSKRRAGLELGAAADVINWESVRLHSRVGGFGSIRLKACKDCGGKEEPRPDEDYKGAVPESQCEIHPKELNLKGYKTVIADEGHKAKDPNAKQTRAMWAVMHSAANRFILTGTPIADNVGDLWSLLHAIDPESFPVKSKFLDTFAVTKLNFFGGFEVLGLKPERADVFRRILRGYMRRTPKSLALPQLPPKLPTTYRYVKMKPQQLRQYQQMKKGFLTLLDGDIPLTAKGTAEQFARLRQFASATGAWDPETEKVKLTAPSPKVDDLAEFMQENPKPLVVAADSKQLLMLAADRLREEKYRIGLITGDQDIDERDAAVQQFQAGELDAILLTIKAGGTGITLTAADTLYFLERSDSNIENKQTEDRIFRIGSEIHDSVRVVVVLVEDSIEDNREYNLALKEGRFQEVIQDRELAKRMLK